jgi:hypothetical protein
MKQDNRVAKKWWERELKIKMYKSAGWWACGGRGDTCKAWVAQLVLYDMFCATKTDQITWFLINKY